MEELLKLIMSQPPTETSMRRYHQGGVFSLPGEIGVVMEGVVSVEVSQNDEQGAVVRVVKEREVINLEDLESVEANISKHFVVETQSAVIFAISASQLKSALILSPATIKLKLYEEMFKQQARHTHGLAESVLALGTFDATRKLEWAFERLIPLVHRPKKIGWDRLSSHTGLSAVSIHRAIKALKNTNRYPEYATKILRNRGGKYE